MSGPLRIEGHESGLGGGSAHIAVSDRADVYVSERFDGPGSPVQLVARVVVRTSGLHSPEEGMEQARAHMDAARLADRIQTNLSAGQGLRSAVLSAVNELGHGFDGTIRRAARSAS
jgi:hypothetical protein